MGLGSAGREEGSEAAPLPAARVGAWICHRLWPKPTKGAMEGERVRCRQPQPGPAAQPFPSGARGGPGGGWPRAARAVGAAPGWLPAPLAGPPRRPPWRPPTFPTWRTRPGPRPLATIGWRCAAERPHWLRGGRKALRMWCVAEGGGAGWGCGERAWPPGTGWARRCGPSPSRCSRRQRGGRR